MSELRKLTARTGMIYTNGEAYGTEVYLGVSDKPENWHEIPISQYEEMLRAEEEKLLENFN